MSKISGFKLSTKEQKLLYVLGGLLLIFLAYRLVFQSMQEQKSELTQEKLTLQQEIQTMQTMKENEAAYVERTEDMETEIEEIFDIVPSNVTAEDKIIYAKNLEESYDMDISGISISEGALLYTMNEEGTNTEDDGKFLYSSTISMPCSTDYTSIKAYLRDTASNGKRRSVDLISLAYDSEKGNLSGTITVSMYFLLGSDREYIPETIDSVSTGTSNVFGN